MRRLLVGQGIFDSLTNYPVFLLVHRGQDAEHEFTTGRLGVEWVSHAQQGPHAEVLVDQLAKVFRHSRELAEFDHQSPLCCPCGETTNWNAVLPDAPGDHILSRTADGISPGT